MNSGKETEKLFLQTAEEAGLTVCQPRVIRCKNPVTNKHGEKTKIVTLPDWYVTDKKTGKSAHVEVTNGSGNNPHKKAQIRVVKAAAVKNYVQLTGDQVKEASEQPSTETKKRFLIQLLGWVLMIS